MLCTRMTDLSEFDERNFVGLFQRLLEVMTSSMIAAEIARRRHNRMLQVALVHDIWYTTCMIQFNPILHPCYQPSQADWMAWLKSNILHDNILYMTTMSTTYAQTTHTTALPISRGSIVHCRYEYT